MQRLQPRHGVAGLHGGRATSQVEMLPVLACSNVPHGVGPTEAHERAQQRAQPVHLV